MVQDDLLRRIAEVHIVQAHVALQRRVGHAAVRLVRMAPCPHLGGLLGFRQLAVDVLRIDQLDVAVIALRLLIEHLEDALGAGDAHDDGVDLRRDLVDVAGELPRHAQKRHDHGDGERQAGDAQIRRFVIDEHAAGDRHRDVDDVADVVEDRHQDVGIAVGQTRGVEQILVDLVKLLLRGVLMVEDLDDLLAVDHLFDVAFGLAGDLLLLDEVVRGLAADLPRDDQADAGAQQDDQRHPDAVVHHDAEDRGDDDRR